jgi:predicted transposase/invertase (TIGR01784 family)
MTELKYTFTNDTLFKMLFVRHPDLLKKLVAVLLKISCDSIGKFEIRNPEMPPESLGDKFCRLDINMDIDGQRTDLEIQIENEGDYPERTLFYWAREYSTSLPSAGKYTDLPRTVIISIVGFNLFPCTEYHSEYQALEVTRHTPLTDRMALHYFELPKLPKTVTADNSLELWLSLFRAKTEEDLKSIEALGVQEMSEAITAYRQITVTPEFREMERLRSKARHDEAQALYNAERKKAFEIAQKMMKRNRPINEIVEDTGLTREEVESLRIDN